jgi:hypothetical protein
MSRRSAELPDTTKPARGPWLKIVLIITALVVVVAGVATWYALRPAPQASVDPTPPATAAPVGTGLANGCLAGPDRTAAALIAAQGKAPHTTLGAIELAAAFDRWQAQFPFPGDADSKQVSTALAAKDAAPDIKDLAGTFASRGKGTPGQTVAISLGGGAYFIDSSTPEKVVVNIGSRLIRNGTLSPDEGRANTITVMWEDGWKVVRTEALGTPDEVFSQGTSFTGGC